MSRLERVVDSSEPKFFDQYRREQFDREEERLLRPFFSNLHRPVFVVSGLPPEMVGALIGRHSAAEASMRRVFLDEYVSDRSRRNEYLLGTLALEDLLNLEKARELIERNFTGLGHDSLAATIPLVLGFEGVTQLGAKGIEDVRIGLSPIERSTRYGFFGRSQGGRYAYARSPEIMASPHARLYEEQIDANLDLYAALQEPVAASYRRKFPEASDSRIRRMAFDATRVLLVAGNTTNLGVMVNAQAAENLIIKLRASGLQECREIGEILQEELAMAHPVLVERVKGEFGDKAVQYLSGRQERAAQLSAEFLPGDTAVERPAKGIHLIEADPLGEDKIIARVLWAESRLDYQQVLKSVHYLPIEEKLKIIQTYLGERPDRRSKPGRPFEAANLTYLIVCRFAEWRDLQRNRILTPQWRTLDFSYGIDVGEDLEEFGFGSQVRERLERLAEAHAIIARDHPIEAQYMVAFGALMPYLVTLNFRELVHLAELRTGPGAHPAYAQIASEMASQAAEAYPLLAKAFQFVNWH